MKKLLSLSTKIYIVLIIILAILAPLNVYLPQGAFTATLPQQELPAPKPVVALVSAAMMLIIYGSLGYIGLILAQKLSFAQLWDAKVSNRQRFLIPFYVGVSMGVFFILVDTMLKRFNPYGAFPHPPFPTSVVASATAGIGEEAIFRLFFISFWVWLISAVILKGKRQGVFFWVVSVFSALVFALGHLPSVMLLLGIESVNQIPGAMMAEILLLNGTLSLFAAYYLRKYGFLAAVGIHFWTDIIWHVIWGLFA